MKKIFKIDESKIERLLPDIGSAFATDKITVEGKKINYMIRQQPEHENDSGWQFFNGSETQEYLDDLNNTSIFSINTIANYEPEIIEFLTYPLGTEIERNSKGKLQVITLDIEQPEVIFLNPVDTGTIQITKNWSFNVSTRMLRRYDNGSLVIWRPGITIWLDTYFPIDISMEDRAHKILKTISPNNQELLNTFKNGMQKIKYLLKETMEGRKQTSANIIGLTENKEIQIAIYYDDPKYLIEINEIWNTLKCIN